MGFVGMGIALNNCVWVYDPIYDQYYCEENVGLAIWGIVAGSF